MAIHEQQYVRYDGAIRESGAWRVIAWTGLRTYLSFLRTKLVLLFLWLGPLFFAGMSLLEYALRGQLQSMTGASEPNAVYIVYFLQMQVWSLAILYMTSGCGVVSEDLRYRMFQLYFSKPITRADYAIGKFGSLVLLGALVTVLPAIVVAAVRGAFYVQSEYFPVLATQMAMGVGLSGLFLAVMAAAVAGLSSTTSRTGYVVLSWIGALVVPLILSGIVAIATGDTEFAALWSLTGNMHVVSETFLTPDEAIENLYWVAPLILTLVAGGGIGALYWRISRLEGVA